MSAPDATPPKATVSEEFRCTWVGGCMEPQACWMSGVCLQRHKQAVKRPRVRDDEAIREKLLDVRECYSCERAASDGHHILFRSHGGDDVPENIAPLCHHCHTLLHYTVDEDAWKVRRAIGRRLLRDDPEALRYVLQRKGAIEGAHFLSRFYLVGAKELRKRGVVQARELPWLIVVTKGG